MAEPHRFKKGDPRPANAGRRKGTPNKVTTDMREAMAEAFERKGGVEYLLTLEDDLFVKMLTRTVPNAVEAKIESEVRVKLIDLSDDRKRGAGGVA